MINDEIYGPITIEDPNNELVSDYIIEDYFDELELKEKTAVKVRAVVNKKAPKFKGIAWSQGEFKQLNLSDYLGQYVVLIFYPLNFA